MKPSYKTDTVDGVTFELRPLARYPINPDWVCVRKPPEYVERYKDLSKSFQGCRMVEVGIDQGGSTSYFLKRFKPRALLALDLSTKPLPKLMDFLAEHDKAGSVTLRLGVDQTDTVAVSQLIDETFGAPRPLDMVIDDASHLLGSTTTTFEMLFPRLRSGGVYVIEDWASDHLLERRLVMLAAADPQGELAVAMSSDYKVKYELPMSHLLCQLLVASARNPGWVTEIRCIAGMCEIRRGNAPIEPGTPIGEYIGALGRWLFDKPAV